MFKLLSFFVAGGVFATTDDFCTAGTSRVDIKEFAATSVNNVWVIYEEQSQSVQQLKIDQWTGKTWEHVPWNHVEQGNPAKIAIGPKNMPIVTTSKNRAYTYINNKWQMKSGCVDPRTAMSNTNEGEKDQQYLISCSKELQMYQNTEYKPFSTFAGKSYRSLFNPEMISAVAVDPSGSPVVLAGLSTNPLLSKNADKDRKPTAQEIFQWNDPAETWDWISQGYKFSSMSVSPNGDIFAINANAFETRQGGNLLMRYNKNCRTWGTFQNYGAQQVQAVHSSTPEEIKKKKKPVYFPLVLYVHFTYMENGTKIEQLKLKCANEWTVKLHNTMYNMDGGKWTEDARKQGLSFQNICRGNEISDKPIEEAIINRRHEATVGILVGASALILLIQMILLCNLCNQKKK